MDSSLDWSLYIFVYQFSCMNWVRPLFGLDIDIGDKIWFLIYKTKIICAIAGGSMVFRHVLR
jgi:hypothetical protein